jgi:hypothetical protein
MSGPYTLIPGIQALHLAQTAGNGGILYPRGLTRAVTVVIQGTGTTSGGTLQIEEAYYDLPSGDPVYGGTWSAIGSVINASSVSGAVQSVVHITGSVYALRVRIVTTITGGGTISVWAWGN